VSFLFAFSVLVFILFLCFRFLTATGQFTDDDAPPLPWSVESDEQIIVARTEGFSPVSCCCSVVLCSFVKHSFGPVSTATQSSFAFSILACFSFFFLFFHRLFRHVLAKLIYFLEIKALNSCFYSLINFF